MSEMINRVAAAIETTANAWGQSTSQQSPEFKLALARAAIAAIDTLYVEHAGPYQWTKTWWDAESGMIRSTVINAEDVQI